MVCDPLGKTNLLRNVLVSHGGVVLVILTYEEASNGVYSIGKILFFSFMTHWGIGINSTHKGVSKIP